MLDQGLFFFATGGSGGDAALITDAGMVIGTGHVGSVHSIAGFVATGSPTPSLTYQWKRDGSPIGGATSPTYTAVEADENTLLTRETTADNGVASPVSADAVGMSIFTSRQEARGARQAVNRASTY